MQKEETINVSNYNLGISGGFTGMVRVELEEEQFTSCRNGWDEYFIDIPEIDRIDKQVNMEYKQNELKVNVDEFFDVNHFEEKDDSAGNSVILENNEIDTMTDFKKPCKEETITDYIEPPGKNTDIGQQQLLSDPENSENKLDINKYKDELNSESKIPENDVKFSNELNIGSSSVELDNVVSNEITISKNSNDVLDPSNNNGSENN